MALKYSVRFVLMQTRIKNKPTSLRCFVRFNNCRSPFTTDVKVEPRYFNVKKQQADVTARFDGSKINERLSQIEAFIKSRFDTMVDYPDPVRFSEICKQYTKSGEIFIPDETKRDIPKTLIAYIEHLASESRSGARKIAKGPRKGQKYKPDTIKPYDSTVYVLKQFAKHERTEDYPFKLVDSDFYKRFSAYFYDVLGHSVGYFSTMIKVIKLAMNESGADKLHNYQGHNSREFIKPGYEADTVSLDLDQLKRLQNHIFETDQKEYENARDLFLVGCWTGLRFEDFNSIRKQDIQDDFIRVRTDKTEARVSIPYHPMLRKVFLKYDGGPPPSMHINDLNAQIKVACRLAGLKQPYTIRRNKKGVDTLETHPLYKLISTHTARRSFASNMFRLGIPSLLIMAITGHKTEKSFLKYIRVGEEEKSRMMAERWKEIKWE
ncbi:site-specific integrase [Parapedobacter soli]|uniref:site-specific integrase n=1 Tax=Parapedobacter soli TaxID=416955 RepID=UPI0021C80C8D|nr:site-specific integrase [Parapedobacter soli]